jgi:hypothetical protein
MKCVVFFFNWYCLLVKMWNESIDHGLGLYYCVFDFQQRPVLCSRVTRSIPFVQQFIHYMSKQDIVDYTAHSAQAVHDALRYWWRSMPLILHVAPRTEKFTRTA